MKRIVPVLILALTAIPGLAEEVTHYMPADGLAGTDVSCVCENEGFLWIATNDGLSRFDGKNFKTYRSGEGAGGLTSNNIETVMPDSEGRLWIGLKTGGADVYDPRRDIFTHISALADDYPQRVLCILEDSQGNIWLGSWEEGLFQLTPDGHGRYSVKRHYSSNIISSLVEKPAGKLWIGTYFGMFLYDIVRQANLDIPSGPVSVTQILDCSPRRELWYSTWGHGLGLLTWDDDFNISCENGRLYDGEDIYCFTTGRESQFRIGTWGSGIKPSSEIDIPVTLSFYRDSGGKLWIGTYGLGLYCVENMPEGIQVIPETDAGNSPTTVLLDLGGGKVAVGTRGDGLFILDTATRQLSPVETGYGNYFQRNILSIFMDSRLLVIGTDDLGIRYAPLSQDGSFGTLRTFSVDNLFAKVTAMAKTGDGTLWMGTKQNGVYSVRYDTLTENFTDLTHHSRFGLDEVTGIVQTGPGRLWLSTHRGIFLYDTESGDILWSDSSEMIYCMALKASSGELWLGTADGIKVIADTDAPRLESPAFFRMLPPGSVRDISIDGYGNIWFSAMGRVFCHPDSTDDLFSVNLGSADYGVFFCSCIADSGSSSRIIFGGTDRLLVIDPDISVGSPDDSRILLTDLQIDHRSVSVGEKIYGREILSEAPEYISSVTIPSQCKWIGLYFTDVGAARSGYNYEYRIEDFSPDWLYLDIEKPLTFSQLQPGDYHIAIRPATASSLGNGDGTFTLLLTIPAPWWRTAAFYWALALFCILMIVAAILLTISYYRRRQQKYRDELEKKEKEELLREKESFFIELSHDIMTPFSLILAPVYDLVRDPSLNEDQKEKLDIIFRNAELLSSLFNSMLDFRRVEISASELHGKDIELVSFCRFILNAFDYSANTGGIHLSFSSCREAIHVHLDTVKLERVLYNLINNAVKFTDSGGTVRLSIDVDEAESRLEIRVSDTGKGISAENREKIFEKFYREKRDDSIRGLGLGLYTARRFVEAMGGQISVDSEVGKGSVFLIRLPWVMTEPAVPEQKTDEAPGAFSILLVEDNSQLRNYLKSKLSGLFNVAVATDGAEALRYIRSNLPELVISDVMMPVMDGLELCRQIKRDTISSDIFVILLSARNTMEDEAEGYKAGADFYIRKPFDPDVLVNHVKNVYATCQKYRRQASRQIEGDEEGRRGSGPGSEFINKAVATIEQYLQDETFRIDRFAQELGVSKSALNRKFNLLLGESPNTFIRKYRLSKAAQMLRTTDLTVSEIAYMTGFSQAHYFIKCFREIYGMTPKNWRENNR